jgi:hypothetical protein
MIAARQIAFGGGGKRKPYDAEVEWIGFSVTNTGDARNTDIVIEGVEWDSFSVNIKIPFTSLIGYRSCTGGPYIYYGCNRIGFRPERTYRGGASYMGIADGISVPTDRFVLHESPSPTKLYWNIDGVEYPVARCANTGGVFRVFSSEGTSTMGYYVSSCKLFKNGETTLDLIPVRKGNVGYMYDRVSGQLFGNQGTGEFVLGPDIIDYTAKDYIQDGLVAMWDGIENAGWGVHDPNATVWKDLVHGISMPLVAQCSFEDNAMRILATAENLSTAFVSIEPTNEEHKIINSAFNGDSKARADYESTVEAVLINRDAEANSDLLMFNDTGGECGVKYTAATGVINKRYGPSPIALKLQAKDNEVVSVSQSSVFRFTDNMDYASFAIYERGVELLANETEIANGDYRFGRMTYRPIVKVSSTQRSRLNTGMHNPKTGTSKDISYYTVRIYNRALTAEEIAHNYEIDKARFGL